MPHGGEQGAHADAVAVGLGAPLAFPEARVDRLDDLFEGEALFEVLLGGVADLGVDDAVLGEVLGALGGDPEQRLAGLHDGAGVGEGLQVALEGAGVGGLAEPDAELVWVGLREVLVALFQGEFDDGAGAKPAVEVVVQQHLGGANDLLGGRNLRVSAGLARHFGTLTPTRVDTGWRPPVDT